MEAIFVNIELEKDTKAYMLFGDLLVVGPVCPFLGKVHIENSYGKLGVFSF
ncbi:hypothetical protein [Bacillus paramycoides]|uniref:hypothetical protein n=1 Tax=Bacillus paramycoides TaxID=2026194 RepID=UPI002244BDE8|nr:hypothetical protein [Bacillus paramycoides]